MRPLATAARLFLVAVALFALVRDGASPALAGFVFALRPIVDQIGSGPQ